MEPEHNSSHLKQMEATIIRFEKALANRRNTAVKKFPVLFLLLSTFGLVATFYGFEKMIDTMPVFHENPAILLLCGLGTLIITGSLYKKL